MQGGRKQELIDRLIAARKTAQSSKAIAEQPKPTLDSKEQVSNAPQKQDLAPKKGSIGRKPLSPKANATTLPSRDSLRARRVEKKSTWRTIWQWLVGWLPWNR